MDPSASRLAEVDLARLGRLCAGARDEWIRAAPAQPGIERIEARFAGKGYEPHRHDTYAVGLTIEGVQSFRYRGSLRHSLPGQAIVLHPDEVHDGAAGTEAGLRYRMVYLDPRLLLDAAPAPRAPLPFVDAAVVDDHGLRAALRRLLADLRDPLDALAVADLLAQVADGLLRCAGGTPAPPPPAAGAEVKRSCDYLAEHFRDSVGSRDLERVSGLDRFTLARQFRRVLGTTPHRYLVMRRLDRARRSLQSGAPLADAAVEAGFADQSHMNRHFKKAYGMTPGRWAALARAG